MISDIARKRCREIYDGIAKESWNTEITDDIIDIRKRICNNINNHSLLDKYDNKVLKIHSKTEEQIYIQAFADGRRFEKQK